MKNIVLVTFPLLILINILFGRILSGYDSFNVWLVSITLLINGILLYAVYLSNIQDAYKISLSGIYFGFMLIQITLALYCHKNLTNNFIFISYIGAHLIQIILGLIIYNIAKK